MPPDIEAGDGLPSYEEFFAAEWVRLFHTMVLLTGDRAHAEDLAQEAMARAFERWGRIRRADSPAAYVYQIAFNLHRSLLRRARRALRRDAPVHEEPANPEVVVGSREEILGLLRSLPATQREALVLVEWVGMSAEEAGRTLGIDAASVRGRIHRARQSIRGKVGNDDA
jgi:RNA polymerase sigma factor (sigma-70 family)